MHISQRSECKDHLPDAHEIDKLLLDAQHVGIIFYVLTRRSYDAFTATGQILRPENTDRRGPQVESKLDGGCLFASAQLQ